MSGIPAWAVPGAEVVCIAEPWAERKTLGLPLPVKGERYTIRLAFLGNRGAIDEHGVFLNELRAVWGEKEYGYELAAFRPLVTRSQEQDIATHFRDLLRQPEPVA